MKSKDTQNNFYKDFFSNPKKYESSIPVFEKCFEASSGESKTVEELHKDFCKYISGVIPKEVFNYLFESTFIENTEYHKLACRKQINTVERNGISIESNQA